MKAKLILAVIGVSGFILYISGCSKANGDTVGAGMTCDTTHVSYSSDVVPILRNRCYSCHKGPGASSSFDFSNYESAKNLGGLIVDAITHTSDFTPMPYGLPMLPSCEINTIVAWVNQGTPNN